MSGILSNHHKITLLGIRRHVQNMTQKMCSRGIVTGETIFVYFLQLTIQLAYTQKYVHETRKIENLKNPGN